MARRHVIPTHLSVEDRAFLGLSVRQFMDLSAGMAGSYGMWTQWPDLPVALRGALAALALLTAVAAALVHPGGRRLEEWLLCAIRFAIVPRTSIWLPASKTERRLPVDAGWEELRPAVSWQDDAA